MQDDLEMESVTPETGVIDLAHEADFQLASTRVSPSLRRLSGPAAQITVEPKVMQVLVALAHPVGKILSRDDLINQCWDGRIVGDASINRVISLLRTALRDAGEDAAAVDTVPKVGYRVVVQDNQHKPDDDHSLDEAIERSGWFPQNSPVWLSALLLVAIVTSAVFWAMGSPSQARATSIALLPISATDSIDPLFAAGMESELRSEIARHEATQISAPDSAAQLLDQGYSAIEIGKRLNVDFVLVPELDNSAERIALSLEAIDVSGEDVVWAQTIASAPGEARALPQRAARELMTGLSAPFESGVRDNNVSEADFALYLNAVALTRSRNPDQLLQAQDLLQQVVERNPNFSQGWSGLAKARFLAGGPSAEDQALAAEDARTMAARALEIDPDSVEARKIAGLVDLDAAQRHRLLTEAVELDPGDAEAWFWLSHVSAHPDYAGQELDALVEASRLDPLWDRTWQAPAYAASAGRFDLADELDRNVIAAAAHPWQAALAEARIELRRGNLSEFFRLVNENLEAMTPSAKQVSSYQLSNMRVLLSIEPSGARSGGIMGIFEQVVHGSLPSQAELDEAGIRPSNFWRLSPISIGAPSLFIRDERTDELLRYYDEGLGSPEALSAFGEAELRPHHFIPNIAIYVGSALREVGRDEEAQALFELAEDSVARWQASDYPDMTATIFEANLAAAKGERARAVAAVRLLVEELGWPYALHSPGVALQGPLGDDPVWSELQDDPELQQILRPLRQSLARERDELMPVAIGFASPGR